MKDEHRYKRWVNNKKNISKLKASALEEESKKSKEGNGGKEDGGGRVEASVTHTDLGVPDNADVWKQNSMQKGKYKQKKKKNYDDM